VKAIRLTGRLHETGTKGKTGMKLKALMLAGVALIAPMTPVMAQEMPAATQTDDQSLVNAAAAELMVVNASAAYGNLTLPVTFNGATVRWSSDNESLVTRSGEVTRPK